MKNECKKIVQKNNNFQYKFYIFSQSPQETMLNKIRTLENRMQLMTNQVRVVLIFDV
jgi:hypothetical protein